MVSLARVARVAIIDTENNRRRVKQTMQHCIRAGVHRIILVSAETCSPLNLRMKAFFNNYHDLHISCIDVGEVRTQAADMVIKVLIRHYRSMNTSHLIVASGDGDFFEDIRAFVGHRTGNTAVVLGPASQRSKRYERLPVTVTLES